MISWMRDYIAELWHNRKSSRATERQSLNFSSVDKGSSDNNSTMFMPVATTSENFPINVISLEGDVLNVAVKADFTIERIKAIAIKHFYGEDTLKMAPQYRLIHTSKIKKLVDNYNINDENIKEHDELMLVVVNPPVKENLTDEALKGPTQEAIMQATSNLPVLNLPSPPPPTECPADFQNEIRKILVTLVQASAKILVHSPSAPKFYNILKEKLEDKCKPNVDPKTVKTLVEMGYSERKVLKALYLRKSNMTEALEWLIEHQDDPDDDNDDIDLDLPIFETDTDEDIAGPSSPVTKRKKSLRDACIELFKGSNRGQENEVSKKEENLISIVDLLLQIFRHYKKMDFKPNPKVLQSLLDMGFEEKNIIDALKVTGNNQVNACEWLIGERRRSLQDLDEGLDPDGPICKAIMNNPHIQLSLTNPKMLLAYLSMLETPTSTYVWLNDPEVSPVLSQIIKTYHAEKHAIHVNRYMIN